MCVYPGITTPKTSSARARIASLTLAISRTISSIESRRYRRRSSATWSFLLLPVGTFPPLFPSRRGRNCSTPPGGFPPPRGAHPPPALPHPPGQDLPHRQVAVLLGEVERVFPRLDILP